MRNDRPRCSARWPGRLERPAGAQSILYTNAPPFMDAFDSRFREVGTVLRRSMNPTLREVEMPSGLLEKHIALYTEDEWYFVADAAGVRDHVRRGWVLLDEGVELKGD